MILTKSIPFSRDDIERVSERFESYIKTVIDIERKICSAGCDRHFESEQILLEQGSHQDDIWGGGIDLETMTIDCFSFINIRPHQNTSNEILDPHLRQTFGELSRYFFRELYG